MTVTTLYFDHDQKADAEISDVDEALRRLDGVERTLVVVELPSGRTLTVGGGPDRFVVEIAETDTVRWAAINPQNPDETIELVVGGQLVDQPARLCVNRQVVLEAARTFVEQRGARSQKLTWSRET